MASGTPSGWEWSPAPGWEAGSFKRPLHTLQRVSIGRSWLCDEAFVNIPELQSSRASRLVDTSCAGDDAVAPCPPSGLARGLSSICCPEWHPLRSDRNVKRLLEVCEPFWQTMDPRARVVGASDL